MNKPRVWDELSLVPQGTLSYPFFLEDGAYGSKRRVVSGRVGRGLVSHFNDIEWLSDDKSDYA